MTKQELFERIKENFRLSNNTFTSDEEIMEMINKLTPNSNDNNK